MIEIGLDYGHGEGTFPPSKGVTKNGKGYEEHHFNSKLGLKLKALLKHNGFEVFEAQPAYSAEVGLTNRIKKYNARKVDLLWSIHANAGAKSASGACAFYWHSSSKSKTAAQLVVEEFKASKINTHGNGLHASMLNSWTNLAICRDAKMPAVLTENGFMTNDKDFENIFGSNQEKYTDQLSKAHARAICRYFGKSFKDLDGKVIDVKPKPIKAIEPDNHEESEYKGDSVVDYLSYINVDNSFSNRVKLAKEYGISNYKGTAAQNTTLLAAMRKDEKVSDDGEPNTAPKLVVKNNYTGDSIVDFLNLQGIDSGFNSRKKLASQYGISNYKGTASQNNRLLDAMRDSRKSTSKRSSYKGNSLVDYLKSIGEDSSFENRKKLAAKYGIKNYKGTAAQNLQLLNKMR